MLKLDEYSYIDCDKPFANVVFKFDDDKITFTVRGDKIDVEIKGNMTLEAVEEAIAIVKSRTLTF